MASTTGKPTKIDDLTGLLDQLAADADELTDADDAQQDQIRKLLNDVISSIQKLQ